MAFNRKEYMKKYNAVYRKKHIEKARAYDIVYKKENSKVIKNKRPGYREKNAEKIKQQVWKNKLKSRYGLSPTEFYLLVGSQEEKCAICGEKVKLHIDHNHKTGEVRGLLCGNCNRGLGLFKDDTRRLSSAIKYLKKDD